MNIQSLARATGALLSLLMLSGAAIPAAVAAQTTTSMVRASVPFDRQFIDMMVPHHQGAVAMAQIAVKRGQHAQIKAVARAIIKGQQSEISRLKAWRKAWYGSSSTPSMENMPMLPGMSMSGMHMDMMGDVKKLRTAKTFDKAFIDAMIPHHQSAVEAAQLELKRGSHAQLKALARSIIAAQNREIRQMKSWRKAWYGTGGMGSMGNMGH